jgi:probable F420-dependent oxidoreductase
MRVGVTFPNFLSTEDQRQLVPIAQAADRLGFDSVWANDHLLRLWGIHFMDALTMVSVAAGATQRVRLGTAVLLLPHHRAALLAHACASIDVLSGGRLMLGVGVGWSEEEFAALGVPLRERGARGDEALEVMKRLWQGGPQTFDGRFTQLSDSELGTAPLTPGGPPVWVGGSSDAALRRTLRYGSGWLGTGADPAALREIHERLERMGETLDRDAGELEIGATAGLVPPGEEPDVHFSGVGLGGESPSAASIVEALGRLGEAGASLCAITFRVAPERVPAALEWFAADVLSQVQR